MYRNPRGPCEEILDEKKLSCYNLPQFKLFLIQKVYAEYSLSSSDTAEEKRLLFCLRGKFEKIHGL